MKKEKRVLNRIFIEKNAREKKGGRKRRHRYIALKKALLFESFIRPSSLFIYFSLFYFQKPKKRK